MTKRNTAEQKVQPKRKAAVKIGKRLKALRLRQKLTQKEMGAQFGLSDSTWRLYELGLRIPNDEIKKEISRVTGRSVDELFFK